jgi:hypothetical protein
MEEFMHLSGARLVFCFGATTMLIAGIAGARRAQETRFALSRAAAIAAFEKIKKLDGDWSAKSTKGWREGLHYRVIANGTAVTSQSAAAGSASLQEGDSPAVPMLTVFYMDGDRLMLTHYCEAGNQPRMVATSVTDGGRTIHFSFLDATNMSSSAAGHMHSVVMTFIDNNHFSDQWSWYQNGSEKWMEYVENERARPAGQ